MKQEKSFTETPLMVINKMALMIGCYLSSSLPLKLNSDLFFFSIHSKNNKFVGVSYLIVYHLQHLLSDLS